MNTLGFFLLVGDLLVAASVGIVFFLTRGLGRSYFGSFFDSLYELRYLLLFTVLVNLLYLCLLLTVSATT